MLSKSEYSSRFSPLHRVLIPVQNAMARQVRLREPTSLYPVSHVNLHTVLKVKSSVVQIMLPFLGIINAGHVFTGNEKIKMYTTCMCYTVFPLSDKKYD